MFCGGFHQKDLKFHTLMVFFGKKLLQSCIFHQNFFTEARIYQKSAAGKSAAHFTLVPGLICQWLISSLFTLVTLI